MEKNEFKNKEEFEKSIPVGNKKDLIRMIKEKDFSKAVPISNPYSRYRIQIDFLLYSILKIGSEYTTLFDLYGYTTKELLDLTSTTLKGKFNDARELSSLIITHFISNCDLFNAGYALSNLVDGYNNELLASISADSNFTLDDIYALTGGIFPKEKIKKEVSYSYYASNFLSSAFLDVLLVIADIETYKKYGEKGSYLYSNSIYYNNDRSLSGQISQFYYNVNYETTYDNIISKTPMLLSVYKNIIYNARKLKIKIKVTGQYKNRCNYRTIKSQTTAKDIAKTENIYRTSLLSGRNFAIYYTAFLDDLLKECDNNEEEFFKLLAEMLNSEFKRKSYKLDNVFEETQIFLNHSKLSGTEFATYLSDKLQSLFLEYLLNREY